MLFSMMILAGAPAAVACGGMFCDAVAPVDQAAERIFFFVHEGRVTTEVQITYEGESDEFAWVVPVPGEPTVTLSNDAMFTLVANQTTPTLQLTVDRGASGGCLFAAPADFSKDTASANSYDDGGAISVVSREAVGPYDMVVLLATDAQVLVGWLQDNGYDLPDGLDATLEPYVASQQYFVALKLQSDKDAGDIAPIAMTYAASAASIPIQLTAVAAVDDMPIEVFVFGEARAVPDNYLSVELNEAAFNWYEGADNYREVVSAAVDEAGGLAFVTDWAAPSSDFTFVVYDEGWVDEDHLATLDPVAFLEAVLYGGLPRSTQGDALLVELVPPPEGVGTAEFLSCPSCYTVEVEGWDPAAAAARVDEELLAVHRAQQERIDRSDYATRLFTTMDPGEMTADPVFVLNGDVPADVSAVHAATSTERENLFASQNTRRTLSLADGRQIVLDGLDDSAAARERLGTPAAIRIVDMGANGLGEVVFDHRDAAAAEVTAFNNGCDESAGLVAPWVVLGAGLLRRRRR